jgi:hypothetical protein
MVFFVFCSTMQGNPEDKNLVVNPPTLGCNSQNFVFQKQFWLCSLAAPGRHPVFYERNLQVCFLPPGRHSRGGELKTSWVVFPCSTRQAFRRTRTWSLIPRPWLRFATRTRLHPLPTLPACPLSVKDTEISLRRLPLPDPILYGSQWILL